MSTPTLAQQRAFFETYGFLKLPGLLKPEITDIITEFEAVFPQLGIKHEGKQRTMIVGFVDQRAGLSRLLDHPGVLEAVGNLIGPDFNYLGSDGNYYTGDTGWHRDSCYQSNGFIKLALYLDPVRRNTGCLRVIPGSHSDLGLQIWNDDRMRDSENAYAMHGRDLPSYPLENEPGDVLIFNHRTLHASFGGNAQRRMFTMNLSRRAKDSIQFDDLISYGDWHFYNHGIRAPYGKAMLETASPARQTPMSPLRSLACPL